MSKQFAVGSLIVGLVLASAGVLKCQARLMAQDIKPVQPAPIGTINDLKDNQPTPKPEQVSGETAKRNQRPGVRDRRKWEYKVVQPVGLELKLNELGDEGWELVSVNHTQSQSWAYFKRPQ